VAFVVDQVSLAETVTAMETYSMSVVFVVDQGFQPEIVIVTVTYLMS
jgi:hypothetical protein